MMDAERWARVEQIYLRVLDFPPERRTMVLEESCSDDPDLLQELESLLEAREEAGHFLSPEQLCLHIGKLGAEPAAPAVGDTLGPYRILAEIGSGAMGEVFRARDSRLDRYVALKILLAHVTHDGACVMRFQSEARAAAALNHPNIVTIYEIGQVEETWFIAEELIEGFTLRQLLKGGKLPVEHALALAIQCAGALSAAHRAGIVHRDIKPENIMVRPDGVAKIVDFGLARIAEPRPEWAVDATKTGSVMGTPRYMSPEQARGEQLDARSDIFSLGAVLFEMVSGRPAFPGTSTAEVFAALLGSEPDFAKTGPLGRIISRALAKDPELRYQSMEGFANDLRNIDLLESNDLLKPEKERRPHRLKTVRSALFQTGAPQPALFVVVFLAVVAFAAYLWLSHRELPASGNLSVVALTTFGGFKDYPAFSPDGSSVAFSWKAPSASVQQIYVKPTEAGEPRRLTFSSEEDILPAWSPDGHQIAFCRRIPAQTDNDSRGRVPVIIYVVPALGGAERKIVQGWKGVSWSADGKKLAVARVPGDAPDSGGIDLVSLESGERHRLTASQEDKLPVFSPNGKWIAFTRVMAGRGQEIFIVAASGGPVRQLTFDGSQTDGATWTADSRDIVFASSRNRAQGALWRIPIAGGTPRPLSAAMKATFPSISRKGDRLAFTESWTDTNIHLRTGKGFMRSGMPSRFGEPSGIIMSTQADHSPAFSPDGERIAFVSARSGNEEIWEARRDGSDAVQLTAFGNASAGSPCWSPDGLWIAFDTWAAGEPSVYVIDRHGGPPRRLSPQRFDAWMPAWSHDGQWIYFTSRRSGTREIWKMPAAGGSIIQVTHGGAYEARSSPDAQAIYFTKSTATGCCAIWFLSASRGTEEPVRELEKFDPISRSWGVLKDGIYFIARNNDSRPTVRFLSFAAHEVAEVATLEKEPGWVFPALAMSADGRHLLTVQIDREVNDLMMIENLR